MLTSRSQKITSPGAMGKRWLGVEIFLLLIGLVVLFVIGSVIRFENILTRLDFLLEHTPLIQSDTSRAVQITEKSTYDALHFDPAKRRFGVISYKLSKPGWIRIRIVSRKNPDLLIRTLVDRRYKPAGKHTEKWDGMDESGNPVNPRKCLIIIEDIGYKHRKHDLRKCKDMDVKIITPEQSPSHQDTLKGEIPLKAIITGNYRRAVGRGGYQIRSYLDDMLIGKYEHQKGEEGFPFCLNTASFDNGEHLLTVNVDDYHDHVGTASLRVKIKN